MPEQDPIQDSELLDEEELELQAELEKPKDEKPKNRPQPFAAFKTKLVALARKIRNNLRDPWYKDWRVYSFSMGVLLVAFCVGFLLLKPKPVVKPEIIAFEPGIHTVQGSVQKGPFVTGSEITIQELDSNLNATGLSYNVTTESDLGDYQYNGNLNSQYVEIIASGFYYDEVRGGLSSSNLTLRALADIATVQNVNVNVLTTLSNKRIKYLITQEGLPFAQAKEQAESELLNVFNIIDPNTLDFEQMDLTMEGVSNGILLAISSVLQGHQSVAELSELMAKMIIDLQDDGVLSDTTLEATLINNASALDINSIKNNLLNRYAQLGLETEVPPLELYSKRLLPFAPVQIEPHDDATEIGPDATIAVLFNKQIDTNTVNLNTFVVSKDSQIISGTIEFSEYDQLLTFVPDNEIAASSHYEISISNTVSGVDLDTLQEEYYWDFHTAGWNIQSGLVSHYELNGFNDGILIDSSGNSHDGIVHGIALVDDRHGNAESAYEFNLGDYLKAPASINLYNTPWSFSLWINQDVPTVSDILYHRYTHHILAYDLPNVATNTAFLGARSHGNTDFSMIAQDKYQSGNLATSSTISSNTWHHIVAIYDTYQLKIYADNNLILTREGHFDNRLLADNYLIGYTPSQPMPLTTPQAQEFFGSFLGDIDDIRFYDRALNQFEVKILSML